ncbi:hypothetical protein RHGRI_028861 [Rhododendron griersonianum]|uniref:Uncharacterized protein n=1 Tax=Rhododendron griersonianum TaxID=479676 RepID=A0AAV6II49_9ERIC|nr:hypothetical protein RHGRI_028859 [Rhododendron griersonianum]KAG5528063.1 hypothetical protein RHGRI_028861 [Rhododendron griersonianum]
MGNYISCALSTQSKHSAARVIYPTGEIKQFHETTNAAEVMMEAPNFFLVNAMSLQIGRRFSALSADEDLELSAAYVMFPMKRLGSVVTAADMGVLFLTANSRRVAAGNVRVLPEPPEAKEAVATPKLNLDDMEEFSTLEIKHRLSMCRSKKPLLETIAEEPISSR